jgi:mono/diheme cytochrome c family protein/peroxiredoxin
MKLRQASVLAALTVAALGATTLTTGAGAQAPAAQAVDDFVLPDQHFLARQLYRMSDAKAVVLITYASGDAVVRREAGAYEALKAVYKAKGVEVMMLASKIGETREKVAPEAKALGLSMPILFDYDQLIGEGLNVTRAAETIVIDPKTWTVAYRGPVDGAGAALDALVAGQKPSLVVRTATGGTIAFPERGKAHERISYANAIAPIIEKKCATCHQPGGIGPMPLNSYEQVKGFSPMIREVVRTHRMPPYLADPTVGAFADDDRLTSEQIKTLVHWVEAGAPRGKGDDPLAKIKFQAPDWPLGKPDVIVEIPEAKIPASGVMEYQRPVVPSVLTEGRWMKATTFRVTDRQVVHHILTGVVEGEQKPGATASESQWGASLGGYGPGRGSNISPPNTGTWVPPSGGIAFQNHYTPYGRETVEKTQMGLYFYPKGQEPKYVLRTFGIFDFSIVIPPGEEWHQESAYVDVPKEMVLYGLTPHAHHRGGSVNVTVRYPNGKEQMLLALPRYEFEWQYEYFLKEPLKIPAGSKVITRWTFDNSTRNPSNPDPKIEVRWGEQSSEEMLALYLHYRWTDETVASQKPENDKLMQAGLMMGVMDDDMNGKLTPAELKGNMGENLKKYFALIDTNKDGGVEQKELDAAMKLMPRRGRGGGMPTANATPTPAGGVPGGR